MPEAVSKMCCCFLYTTQHTWTQLLFQGNQASQGAKRAHCKYPQLQSTQPHMHCALGTTLYTTAHSLFNRRQQLMPS